MTGPRAAATALLLSIVLVVEMASSSLNTPASAATAAPSPRTTLSVTRGSVEARTATDKAVVHAGDTITIGQGRIHRRGTTGTPDVPRTRLAVFAGSVTARAVAPANWADLVVGAGLEAVFGETVSRRTPIDADRVRYAQALARGVSPGDENRLSGAVRVALVRLNAAAAERLTAKDLSGLRSLAVPDARVGARPLHGLIAQTDEVTALTRTVDVAYRVTNWRSAEPNGASARYAATVRLTPTLVPNIHAEIVLTGTVRYRRRAGAWRFERFGIDHASVNTRGLPAAFDRLDDLLIPE